MASFPRPAGAQPTHNRPAPFSTGSGIPGAVTGLPSNPATLASLPPADPNDNDPAIAPYSAAAEERVLAISPWRRYVTTLVPGPEVLRYSEHGAKGAGYTQPSVTIGGP